MHCSECVIFTPMTSHYAANFAMHSSWRRRYTLMHWLDTDRSPGSLPPTRVSKNRSIVARRVLLCYANIFINNICLFLNILTNSLFNRETILQCNSAEGASESILALLYIFLLDHQSIVSCSNYFPINLSWSRNIHFRLFSVTQYYWYVFDVTHKVKSRKCRTTWVNYLQRKFRAKIVVQLTFKPGMLELWACCYDH